MKRNTVWLAVLILICLIKQLAWVVVVPLWQAPDEQAHFAQLQDLVEGISDKSRLNLSKEVALSEELLGTRRDNQGNNKFTYHSEYKIEYSRTETGIFEKTINSQPVINRRLMVDTEAAAYPPLYYFFAEPFYRLVYFHGLVDRVFAVRLLSVIFNLGFLMTTYFIGMLIWRKRSYAMGLSVLVAFQPMISFVASGVHPDNLLNLIAAMAITTCLLILKNGIKIRYLVILGILSFLGMETKPFMVFLLPGITALVVYKIFNNNLILATLVLLSPLVAFLLKIPIPYMPVVGPGSPLGNMGVSEYLRFRLSKTAFEIWPWFWGVFKWLGVVLPAVVLKVITRVTALAMVGIFVRLIFMIRNHKMTFENQVFVWFMTLFGSCYLYLIVWDYRLMQSMGYSIGLQGRYLFLVIVPFIALLIFGLVWSRFDRLILGLLCLAMVILNGLALLTVANSYYNLSSNSKFLIQVTQYKPVIVKLAIGRLL